LGFEQL
jgi:hypothetical protein